MTFSIIQVAFFATLFCLSVTPVFAQVQNVPDTVPGLRYTDKGEIVVPMIFPVLGNCRWSDTWGAPRDGGKRKHIGQDLPAPKMRPLLACFDGIWTGGGIEGDNGCYATYMHINNDHPGTDDGKGGDEFAYAPGLYHGMRVRAGQHIAYCGDSGNAENTISHLHFELSVPGRGKINAAASLRVATVLKKPRYFPERPEARPSEKELRVDGEVVSIDTARGVMLLRVGAWGNGKGKITPQTRPMRRWIKMTNTSDTANLEILQEVLPGDFIAAFGKDLGPSKAIATNRVVLLHVNQRMREFVAARARRLATKKQVPSLVSGDQVSAARQSNEHSQEIKTGTPAKSAIGFNFEHDGYAGWELSGDCWGYGPEGAAFAGKALTGREGNRFATTAHPRSGGRGLESGSGRAISKSFVIPENAALQFRVAGGRYEGCCMNLLVNGVVVRSAGGETPYAMRLVSWDLSDLQGQTARLEIRDDIRVGAHAYIHVDDIQLTPSTQKGSNL